MARGPLKLTLSRCINITHEQISNLEKCLASSELTLSDDDKDTLANHYMDLLMDYAIGDQLLDEELTVEPEIIDNVIYLPQKTALVAH